MRKYITIYKGRFFGFGTTTNSDFLGNRRSAVLRRRDKQNGASEVSEEVYCMMGVSDHFLSPDFEFRR